ncbi:MAG: hypothetical protein GF308_20635 [Candidatus Heimdallarchaeota archaeon]|nr:hypothetical protein [Candidatus Heimdallarchaeota archaeon]
MIEITDEAIEITRITIDRYIEWLLTILKYTGLSLGSIILVVFVIWLVINLVIAMLVEFIPILKGIVASLEFIFLPGSLMHMVWHVFALKKLNYKTEHVVSFGWGWSRAGIRMDEPLKSMRDAVLFFYAPILNLPIIIGWVVPGMILFQWLDSLIEGTIFYWIWLYVLLSLIIFGLPDLADLTNPLQISIVKTPEFYLFVVFYVLIAPVTLIFWGWGLTIIFSLLYAISSIYEVEKISRNETKRLAMTWDKVFSEKVPVYIIVPKEADE